MSHDILARTLTSAVTRYDRSQERKRHYNPYALAIYLGRVDDIMDDIRKGADPRARIESGFNDRLRDYVLRFVKEAGFSL